MIGYTSSEHILGRPDSGMDGPGDLRPSRRTKENIVNLQYEMIVTENNSIKLEITNEDFTCGGPLNYVLQGMKEVDFSGVYPPNQMEKNIAITCVIDKKYKIIDIFSKAIDNTIEIYNSIEKKVKKISNK